MDANNEQTSAQLLRRILRERRTVHDFRSEPVPEPVVLDALEAARWAPNHHRTEPWRAYLLGTETRARIARLNAGLVREARGDRAAEVKLKRWLAVPGWLLLTALRSDDARRELEDYAACCCVAQNLMLALWAEGVGSKWTTGKVVFTSEFADIVGVDYAREQAVGLFWYGWPAEIIAQHRQPVETFVTRLD